jgi:hypothetical protein
MKGTGSRERFKIYDRNGHLGAVRGMFANVLKAPPILSHKIFLAPYAKSMPIASVYRPILPNVADQMKIIITQ